MSETNLPAHRWDGKLEEYDEGTLTNVVNLVPEAVAKRLSQLPDNYIGRSEEEMRELLKKRNVNITPTDNRLRIQFWREYEFAQQGRRRMHSKHIYSGVCGGTHFNRLLENKEKLAWILTPPTDYMIASEEALIFGIEQLREILEQSHMNSYGFLDPKIASVKVEIVKMLDMRVKGAVVQTTKNLHLHGNVNEAQKQNTQAPVTPRMEDLDRELQKLRDLSEKLSLPGSTYTPPLEKVIEAEVVGQEVRARADQTET